MLKSNMRNFHSDYRNRNRTDYRNRKQVPPSPNHGKCCFQKKFKLKLHQKYVCKHFEMSMLQFLKIDTMNNLYNFMNAFVQVIRNKA